MSEIVKNTAVKSVADGTGLPASENVTTPDKPKRGRPKGVKNGEGKTTTILSTSFPEHAEKVMKTGVMPHQQGFADYLAATVGDVTPAQAVAFCQHRNTWAAYRASDVHKRVEESLAMAAATVELDKLRAKLAAAGIPADKLDAAIALMSS